MQKTELAERLLSSQAGVESQKLKTGELTDDEWVRLGNAAATYNDVELYLDDTSAITVEKHITARKLMKISKTKLMLIKQSLLLLKTVTVQPAQLN